MSDSFEESKLSIQEIVVAAQEVVAPKIEPVTKIINDIKMKLVHGTDAIPTSTIQEWAVQLSVANTELSSHKEAFSLASALWRVDINNSNARTLAERRAEQKKIEIENQNIIDNRDKETQKIIIDYMASMIKDAQENIYQLCSELNRILDGRNWDREKK